MSDRHCYHKLNNEVLMFYQGTIVDRIDYNIQNVATSVEEGFKQLQKVLSFLSLFYTHMESFIFIFINNVASTMSKIVL